jgi:hypothetical protein
VFFYKEESDQTLKRVVNYTDKSNKCILEKYDAENKITIKNKRL